MEPTMAPQSPPTIATSLETKYQKLATEYSKVRAQAAVLKRALLDEQQKSGALRDTLRLRDTSLRRIEQEVDSLGFRNKQLEHRVATLQDDLRRDSKSSGGHASHAPATGSRPATAAVASHSASAYGGQSVALLTDELQTRIHENAQLATQLADADSAQQLLRDRCDQLAERAARQQTEHSQLEARLRCDLDTMCQRTALLEARLAGTAAASQLSSTASSTATNAGSEDTLSVISEPAEPQQAAGEDAAIAAADRVAQLERELFRLRTQLEFREVCDIPGAVLAEKASALRRASNGPLGAPWTVSKREQQQKAEAAAAAAKRGGDAAEGDAVAAGIAGDGGGDRTEAAEREKWVLRHFADKMERVFAEKLEADARAASYGKECEALQSNMEILSDKMSEQRKIIERTQGELQLSEEDLATTRINYEEQISVLTEQVISLSDQLAMAVS